MTPAELSASAQERFVADHRRHHRMVTFMRFFILLVFLAVWELCADLKIIDSFFLFQSQPGGYLFYYYAAEELLMHAYWSNAV